MGSDLVLCRSSGLLSLSGLGQVDSQDDFLARELHLHQGCLRHAPHQDGRVDGECRKGYRAYHGRQGVHLRGVQEGERQLPCSVQRPEERLKLLNDTKEAWIGYAENNDVVAVEIEKGLEEITKVKKRFNLEQAFEDLAKRQKIFNDTRDSIMGLWSQIQHNVEVMNLTIPEDIKNSSDKMAPEDRVARTMDLQEDIAAKVEVIKKNAETELGLLPQGDKVPSDAQDFKNELNRITKYVMDLQEKVRKECDAFSEDVKYWAEYKTGIKE